jgi:hypothetical protein
VAALVQPLLECGHRYSLLRVRGGGARTDAVLARARDHVLLPEGTSPHACLSTRRNIIPGSPSDNAAMAILLESTRRHGVVDVDDLLVELDGALTRERVA